MANEHIGLVANDSWLEPYEDAIRGRHDHAVWKIGELTQRLYDELTGIQWGRKPDTKNWCYKVTVK